ncbi:hypothetical protein [Massilia consociata]|uniref:Secreted protein n=1 Tax=Massilia consociata TaxID=760117 RepID=A0ABV6FGI5_9BURK
MRHLGTVLRAACICLFGATLPAHAQTNGDAIVDPAVARQQVREIAQGDPTRWQREDATPEARLRTQRKEIGAALQEARNACRKAPAAERSTCLKEARAIYQRDMQQAWEQARHPAQAQPVAQPEAQGRTPS